MQFQWHQIALCPIDIRGKDCIGAFNVHFFYFYPFVAEHCRVLHGVMKKITALIFPSKVTFFQESMQTLRCHVLSRQFN